MRKDGLLVVLSGPSGCGKDTIISKVLERLSGEAFLSVSMTTRGRRGTEEDGVDYYFVTPEQFRENVENDLMLEYAQYGANFYGTPVGPVKHLLAQGKTVILNIEVQGGKNVRRLIPEAVEIFVAPPSLKELERRLVNRGTETRDAINRRLLIAQAELRCACDYDYIVINDVLEDAVDDVLSIIRASALKTNHAMYRISEVMNHVES